MNFSVFVADPSSKHVFFVLFFDSLHPINNLSVKQGRVFLGWTSTKLGLNCLAQGPQHSDAGEVRTRGPSFSSQALYHWATALPQQTRRPTRDFAARIHKVRMKMKVRFKISSLALLDTSAWAFNKDFCACAGPECFVSGSNPYSVFFFVFFWWKERGSIYH